MSMSDLISRQAVKEWLAKWEGYLDADMIARMQYRVIDIPNAQPEPQWIPCSERLPEVGEDVLFSVGGVYVAEGCLREDGGWVKFRWNATQLKDVVGAWRRLPEPWEGE